MQRGDVVAVALPDGAEMIAAVLGAAESGVCAPLNPWLAAGEMAEVLADLRVRAVVGPGGVEVREAGPARPELADTALLLRTSATTGRAKTAPIGKDNLREMISIAVRALEVTADDCFLSMMPLFHLQGLVSVLAQLQAGGTVVATRGFDAGAFRGWLETYGVTWYTAGPALHRAILPCHAPGAEHELRFVRSIGASMPLDLMQRIEESLGVPVIEGYGLTEAGSVTSNPLPPGRRKAGSVGVSVGPEFRLLDDGEIAIRGASVIAGYLDDADANRESFQDGWLRTGDLGRVDEDGYLYILGRRKEMINRGGEKVLPNEVDSVLLAHSAVGDAAAFGVPHPTLGEEVAAAVVARAGNSVTPEELRAFARERLTGFKAPRRIFLVDGIPKGATGKPRRMELAMRFAETWREEEFVPPHSLLEMELAALWGRKLGRERVGLRDDWFVLGGDSLGLAALLAELEREYGVEAARLESSQFPWLPTVEVLARVMTAPVEESGVLTLQPEGTSPAFYCIPGADENPYYFRHLAGTLGRGRAFRVLRDTRTLESRGAYSVEEQAATLVERLRSFQPRGPYHLGGHCYGGMVAWEMACQLEAAGERSGTVSLFEVPAPGYPKVLRSWRRYLREAPAMVGRAASGGWASVRQQVAEHLRWLRGIRDKELAARAAERKALPVADVHPNITAARFYRPRPLGWDVEAFLASGTHHSTRVLEDVRLGWRDTARGRFTVREVPGEDVRIFEPPHVEALARELRAALDGFDAMA